MSSRLRFALKLSAATVIFTLGLPWVDRWIPIRAGEDQSPPAPTTTTTPGEKSAQSTAPRSKAPPSRLILKGNRTAAAKPNPLRRLRKSAPESPSDLAAIQTAIELVVKKCLPATVGVDINGVEGSGVIVTEDGYVLTAGHVSGMPGAMRT